MTPARRVDGHRARRPRSSRRSPRRSTPPRARSCSSTAGGTEIASGGEVDAGRHEEDDARRCRRSQPGAYEIRWTSASAEDGDLDRGVTTFTVRAGAVRPAPTPTAAPSATPAASRPPPRRRPRRPSSPVAVRQRPAPERLDQRRPDPDRRRPRRRRRARALAAPRPLGSRRDAMMHRRPLRARRRRDARGRACLPRPGGGPRPHPQQHLPEPPAAGRLPRRARRSPSACRSRSCCSRTSAPTRRRRRPGKVPPAWLRYRPAGDRPDRLDLDRRPGHRRRRERRRRHDAVPVGLRLGRRRDAVGAPRPDLALARPVRDDPRHRRAGGLRGRRLARLGAGRLSRRDSGAGRRSIGLVFFVWLELVGDGTGPRTLFIVMVGYTAFTLAMMAQFGRDAWRRDGETFSRLVRAARAGSRRSASTDDPADDPSPAAVRDRPCSLPGWTLERHRDHRPRDRRRSCSTACPRRSRGSTSSARRASRSRRSSCSASSG